MAEVDYAVALYESPHRILRQQRYYSGSGRGSDTEVMGRELTKQFETIRKCSAHELLQFVESDHNQQRGEFVILILPRILEDASVSDELTTEQNPQWCYSRLNYQPKGS